MSEQNNHIELEVDDHQKRSTEKLQNRTKLGQFARRIKNYLAVTASAIAAVTALNIGTMSEAKADEGSSEEEDCFLTSEHWEALLKELQRLYEEQQATAGRIAELEAQLASLKDNDGTTIGGSPSRIGEIEDELQALNGKLDTLIGLIGEREGLLYPYAGWHWGLVANAEMALGNGTDTHAVPLQAEFFTRYVGNNHMGVEAGFGAGGWITEDASDDLSFPADLTWHASGLASGEEWGAQIRGDISWLDQPEELNGGYLLGRVWIGGEYKADIFYIRGMIGTALYSPDLARLGGVWVQTAIGVSDKF